MVSNAHSCSVVSVFAQLLSIVRKMVHELGLQPRRPLVIAHICRYSNTSGVVPTDSCAHRSREHH